MNKIIKNILLFASALFVISACAEEHTNEYGLGKVKSGVVHLTAQEGAMLLESHDDIRVLDIRSLEEVKESLIREDIHIDYYSDSFADELAKLDKDQAYLVHCGSGGRSGKTLPMMKELGFKKILHLDGGMKAWNKLDTQ